MAVLLRLTCLCVNPNLLAKQSSHAASAGQPRGEPLVPRTGQLDPPAPSYAYARPFWARGKHCTELVRITTANVFFTAADDAAVLAAQTSSDSSSVLSTPPQLMQLSCEVVTPFPVVVRADVRSSRQVAPLEQRSFLANNSGLTAQGSFSLRSQLGGGPGGSNSQ